MPELKPCPFCGHVSIGIDAHPGQGRGINHHGATIWSIGCKSCGASVPNRYERKALIAAWNTRLDQGIPPLDLVERAAEAIEKSQTRWIGVDPGSPLFCRRVAEVVLNEFRRRP